MLEAPIDLNSLLSTTTVECVQTIDAGKLTQLLQWVVACLQKQDANERATLEALSAVKTEYAASKQDMQRRLEALQQIQEGVRTDLDKRQSDVQGLTESVDKLHTSVVRVRRRRNLDLLCDRRLEFEELQHKEDTIPSTEATEAQLVEEKGDQMTEALLKRMDSIERRLTSSLEDRAAGDPTEGSVQDQNQDSENLQVEGPGQQSSEETEAMQGLKCGIELLERRIEDLECQLQKACDRIQERTSPVVSMADMKASLGAVSQETFDNQPIEGDRKDLNVLSNSGIAPAANEVGASVDLGSCGALISQDISETPQPQDEHVVCTPDEEPLVRDAEEDDAPTEDIKIENPRGSSLSADNEASPIDERDTKEALRFDDIEDRLAQLEMDITAVKALDDDQAPKRSTPQRRRDSGITNSAERSVPRRLSETKRIDSIGELNHDVESKTKDKDEVVPAEILPKIVSFANDALSDAIADLKSEIDFLRRSKADRGSIDELQSSIESLCKQTPPLDRPEGDIQQELQPRSSTTEPPARAHDSGFIEEMKEDIQGLQKSVRDLLRNLRSMDAVDVETIKQRLNSVENRIKKLSFKQSQSIEPTKPDRVPSGNQAMLSGKPVFGYKCMACDRPLKKLHMAKGPFLPMNALPPWRPKSCGETAAREADSSREPDSPRVQTAQVGPRLRKGGWKTHGNYHKKLKAKQRERQNTT